MLAPRWRKALRDIEERPGRSLLAVLAMAAGVFEIGVMLYSYSVLGPVLTTMYGRTRPSSATFVTDDVSDALVDSIRGIAGVGDAEARPVLMARVEVAKDEWAPAILYVVRDFDRQRMDLFTADRGRWPPGPGDVLLERTALTVAHAKIGDTVALRPPDAEPQSLRVAGTVHAPGLPPAWMDHMVLGFIGWDSALRRQSEAESKQIRIRVADHPLDEGYIREVADSVQVFLERRGHTVSRVEVPTPGRHPHGDQMDAFLFLLGAFGVLSLILSAALVANMVHALMAEQLRQVGVMKAIGATTRQVAGIYLGQVSMLAVAALCLGVPAGIVVGRSYANFSAGILNADITATPFPVWVVVAEIAIGLLLPALFALGPVLRASRVTVHEALNETSGARPFGARRLDRWLASIRGLPRPLALSLRTTFLRRGRLAMTLGMLAVGGAAFMSALNVGGAWDEAVRRDFARRHYDLNVHLVHATPIARIERVLATLPAVERAEYWPEATPYLIGPTGVAGSLVSLVGPDSTSRLLDLKVVDGRWLHSDDTRGVVINQAVVKRNPALHVGGTIGLRIGGRTLALPIVGEVLELTPMPVVYAPASVVRSAIRQSVGDTRTMRVVTRRHDEASARAAARELERALAAAEIEVSGSQPLLDVQKALLDHLVIIMSILGFASAIVALVGGLGLASTLTLNIVQRTREIGILGAIGARPRVLAGQVWFEAIVIGVLSWLLANPIAAPISYALEAVCGRIFFKVPLDFYMSWRSAAIWLALVVVLASLCSFYPARRAARLTVREALTYA